MIFGRPDEAVAKLERYEAAGVDYFCYFASYGLPMDYQKRSLELIHARSHSGILASKPEALRRMRRPIEAAAAAMTKKEDCRNQGKGICTMNTTRRTFLKNATAGLGTFAVGSLSARRSRAAPASLTFVSWGGTTQDAQKASWVDPFTKKTGIAVLEDGPTDYGKLKAMVESGNVTWDVVDVEGFFAHKLAQEGLLEPIDYGVVKNAGLDPRFSFDHGVGSFLSMYLVTTRMRSAAKCPRPGSTSSTCRIFRASGRSTNGSV